MKFKNNNVFKYIFGIVVIALIVGAIYIVYYSKNKDNDVNKDENTTDQSSYDNVSIVENLKMGISNYDTMNPLLTKNKEIINIDKIIFDPLINITSDYKTEMCLAKSCNKINDTKYEIKVDTSIKWQDGSSLISKDVQFTIDKLKELNSSYSANVQYVSYTETPDSETIIINLTQPVQFFEYNLSFPILSNSYYLNEDFNNSNKIPIGTGMYKIASIDDDNIFFIRNERWRELKTNTPKSQSITIHKYNAIGEIFNSFKLGNVDIINTYMTNYSNYIGTMGYNKKEYKGREYDFISMNCDDSVLSDSAVRKAINYGINKEAIISTVFQNSKIISCSPLDYGSYLYSNDNEIKYSQETAKKILEESGWIYTNNKWQKNINGYVKKLSLSLIVSKDNTDRVNVANNIKQQLSDIGIILNVIQTSNDKYYEYLNNKNYQMIITGITNSVNPDLSYFYGEDNIANYRNDNIKTNLSSLENYSDIQRQANEDSPYIGLYRNKGTIVLNANVGGNFAPNNFATYYYFNMWFRQQ